MERAQRDEFLGEKDKSQKRRRDDRDPPSPPLKDSDQRKKKRLKDVPMPDTTHISDSEDTDSSHLPKIKPRSEWLKLIPEEDRPATPEPDWVIPPNELPEPENNWANALASSKERRSALSISKLKAANSPDFGLEELVPSLWIKREQDYDISVAYGISHWWFTCKEFYITRHNALFNRSKVRSHMWILSVVSLKTLERYGNIIIKKRVEDLQLGIESYQTKLNLTQPDWDASDFLFKEDYTIVSKPRADNRRRSKDFMEVIERRLKIQRFPRSLESFIGGRLRDVDYRLIQRTE
ncbi:hypothetical protein Tco_0444753 [Tanacetum coccineum]